MLGIIFSLIYSLKNVSKRPRRPMQKRPARPRTNRERTETARRLEIAGPEHHYYLLSIMIPSDVTSLINLMETGGLLWLISADQYNGMSYRL